MALAAVIGVALAACGGAPDPQAAACATAKARYARLWTDIGSAVSPGTTLRASVLVDDVQQLERAVVRLEGVASSGERPELAASAVALRASLADPSGDAGTEAVSLGVPWTGAPLHGLKDAVAADCRPFG